MKMEISIEIDGLPSLDEQRQIQDFLFTTLKDFEPTKYEYRLIRVLDSMKQG